MTVKSGYRVFWIWEFSSAFQYWLVTCKLHRTNILDLISNSEVNILIKLFSYLVLCSKYKFSLSWLILIQLKLILLWSAAMERNSYNWPWRVRLFVWTQSIWPLWKYEYAFPRIHPYDSEHAYFKQKNIWLIRNDGTKQTKELVIIRNISLSLVSVNRLNK